MSAIRVIKWLVRCGDVERTNVGGTQPFPACYPVIPTHISSACLLIAGFSSVRGQCHKIVIT